MSWRIWCPWFFNFFRVIFQAHCSEVAPEWREIRPGHWIACHEAI
jgi:hypothetical protein